MTKKHFDIPREKIRTCEMEAILTEPLQYGEVTLWGELKTGAMAFVAVVALIILVSLI